MVSFSFSPSKSCPLWPFIHKDLPQPSIFTDRHNTQTPVSHSLGRRAGEEEGRSGFDACSLLSLNKPSPLSSRQRLSLQGRSCTFSTAAPHLQWVWPQEQGDWTVAISYDVLSLSCWYILYSRMACSKYGRLIPSP